jgi:hypothetical protein
MVYFQTVYFGRPWNGKFWYVLWAFGTFKVVSQSALPFAIFCGN